MHRSASTSRVADGCFVSSSSLSSSSSSPSLRAITDTGRQQLLPKYNPLSHVAKKEMSRLRFAENAIHVIPLVLVLCALVLWFFSNPESRL